MAVCSYMIHMGPLVPVSFNAFNASSKGFLLVLFFKHNQIFKCDKRDIYLTLEKWLWKIIFSSAQNELETKLHNLSQSNEEALSKANNQISSLTQRQSKLERTLSVLTSIYNSTVKNWTELLSQKGDVDVDLAKIKNEFKDLSKKVDRYEKLFEILKMDWLGDQEFQPIGTFGSFLSVSLKNLIK